MMKQPDYTSLSDLLDTMARQFRGHAVADGQVVITGRELDGLVETLELAALAAAKMEDDLRAFRERASGGNVIPLTAARRQHGRERHHRRKRKSWTPWTPDSVQVPGAIRSDDDDTSGGGDAA